MDDIKPKSYKFYIGGGIAFMIGIIVMLMAYDVIKVFDKESKDIKGWTGFAGLITAFVGVVLIACKGIIDIDEEFAAKKRW